MYKMKIQNADEIDGDGDPDPNAVKNTGICRGAIFWYSERVRKPIGSYLFVTLDEAVELLTVSHELGPPIMFYKRLGR